jgi:hypothetical protein
MVLTVLDLIKSQLRIVLQNGDSTQDDDDTQIQDAIQANNMMLDSWSAQKLMTRSLIQQSFTLVVGTSSYTIGTGMVFDTAKPIAIPNAFVRDSAGIDYPLNIATEDEFNAIGDKSFASGCPTSLFFDTGQTEQTAPQSGVIYIDTKPDQAYTLYLEQQKYLTEFADPSDTVTFEPAYYEAIKFNGALTYYYEYRSHKAPIPPYLVMKAKESMSVIKNMNVQLSVANFDVPGVKTGSWNIYGSTYR